MVMSQLSATGGCFPGVIESCTAVLLRPSSTERTLISNEFVQVMLYNVLLHALILVRSSVLMGSVCPLRILIAV